MKEHRLLTAKYKKTIMPVGFTYLTVKRDRD